MTTLDLNAPSSVSPASLTPEQAHDALLVVRCQLGEAGALDALVDRWHAPLWSFTSRLAPRAADDVLQETWLRIVQGLPKLRRPERFAAWAHRIARNVAMSRLRRQYGRSEGTDLDALDVDRIADAPALDPAERAVLHREIGRLALTEREVVLLFYFQGLTIDEVSTVVGIPAGTVKSRLHRARRLLRQLLDGEIPFPTEPGASR